MVRAGDPILASDVAVQACRVTRTAALAVADGTALTLVPFTSEEFDDTGMHDTVTQNTRITILVAGYYMIGFNGVFAASNAYTRVFARLLLNGAIEIARDQRPGTSTTLTGVMHVTTLYQFDAGDYVEVQVSQSSGASRNLEATAEYSPEFWAARLGS